MDTTLRDVWGWFIDHVGYGSTLERTVNSAFDKLFDLQILDITFAEWLILGFSGLMIIGGIRMFAADWKKAWIRKKLLHWRSKR